MDGSSIDEESSPQHPESPDQIRTHRTFLEERLDPDFGLLDKLYSNKTLTKGEVDDVKAEKTTERRNKMLLDLILDKNKTKELMAALLDTGQTHLVNYLTADGNYLPKFGDDWPLNERETEILMVNHESLVDLLDTNVELCAKLYSKNVLNKRQQSRVLSNEDDTKKNEFLLDMMDRFSLKQYKTAIDCLRQTKQNRIAKVLAEGGVIVQLHANLDGTAEEVTEEEKSIAAGITEAIGNVSLEAAHRILELARLELIAAKEKRDQSVVLYFRCGTRDDLTMLHDLFTSGRLHDAVEETFRNFRSPEKAATPFGHLRLNWAPREYKKSLNYFSTEIVDDLESTTRLFELPLEMLDLILLKAGLVSMLSRNRQSIDKRRDSEIIRSFASVDDCWSKRILRSRFKRRMMRNLSTFYEKDAKRAKFVRDKHVDLLEKVNPKGLIDRMRHADCLTDRETRSIDAQKKERDKNEALLNALRSFDARQYNGFLYCLLETGHTDEVVRSAELGREEMKGYRVDPVLVETVKTKDQKPMFREIAGMTVLNDELFIVCGSSSEVEVYDTVSSGSKRSLKLKEFGLVFPTDIGSCARSNCLFIVDRKFQGDSSEIFSVDTNGKLIKKWSTGVESIRSLSVTDESNIVITDNAENTIIEYTPDGETICNKIKLSPDSGIVNLWHAIKLPIGLFVVSHGATGDPLNRVCMVDFDGNVLLAFGGARGSDEDQMDRPIYLTADRDGSIAVIDRGNSRVLLLSSELDFRNEIVMGEEEEENEFRYLSGIHFDRSSGHLFVADNDYDDEERIFKDGRVLCFDVRENLARPEEEEELNGPFIYRDDPILIQTIELTKEMPQLNRVFGITMLDNEMFLIHEHSQEVQVYDPNELGLIRSWKMKELVGPYDIRSSDRYRCLYIVNHRYVGESGEILRVDPDGGLIKRWSVGGRGDCGRLSVTGESNVVLVLRFPDENKLIEYSPEGQLVREILLVDIVNPWHSIKLTGRHFVLIHGKDERSPNRVCLVDAKGNVVRSFGGDVGSTEGQLNFPNFLAVDDDGRVVVNDKGNSRVLLLSSTLEFVREIYSKEKHGLRRPSAFHLDTSSGRIFLANDALALRD